MVVILRFSGSCLVKSMYAWSIQGIMWGAEVATSATWPDRRGRKLRRFVTPKHHERKRRSIVWICMNICISHHITLWINIYIYIIFIYIYTYIFLFYTHTVYMYANVHLDANHVFMYIHTRFVTIWIYVYIKLSEFYLFLNVHQRCLRMGFQHVIHGLGEVRCPRFWWLIKIDIRMLSKFSGLRV